MLGGVLGPLAPSQPRPSSQATARRGSKPVRHLRGVSPRPPGLCKPLAVHAAAGQPAGDDGPNPLAAHAKQENNGLEPTIEGNPTDRAGERTDKSWFRSQSRKAATGLLTRLPPLTWSSVEDDEEAAAGPSGAAADDDGKKPQVGRWWDWKDWKRQDVGEHSADGADGGQTPASTNEHEPGATTAERRAGDEPAAAATTTAAREEDADVAPRHASTPAPSSAAAADRGDSDSRYWGREKLDSLLVVLANVPLAPWVEGTLTQFAASSVVELEHGKALDMPSQAVPAESAAPTAPPKPPAPPADAPPLSGDEALLNEVNSLLAVLDRASHAARKASRLVDAADPAAADARNIAVRNVQLATADARHASERLRVLIEAAAASKEKLEGASPNEADDTAAAEGADQADSQEVSWSAWVQAARAYGASVQALDGANRQLLGAYDTAVQKTMEVWTGSAVDTALVDTMREMRGVTKAASEQLEPLLQMVQRLLHKYASVNDGYYAFRSQGWGGGKRAPQGLKEPKEGAERGERAAPPGGAAPTQDELALPAGAAPLEERVRKRDKALSAAVDIYGRVLRPFTKDGGAGGAAAPPVAVTLQPALEGIVRDSLVPVTPSVVNRLRVCSSMCTWVYYLNRVEQNFDRLVANPGLPLRLVGTSRTLRRSGDSNGAGAGNGDAPAVAAEAAARRRAAEAEAEAMVQAASLAMDDALAQLAAANIARPDQPTSPDEKRRRLAEARRAVRIAMEASKHLEKLDNQTEAAPPSPAENAKQTREHSASRWTWLPERGSGAASSTSAAPAAAAAASAAAASAAASAAAASAAGANGKGGGAGNKQAEEADLTLASATVPVNWMVIDDPRRDHKVRYFVIEGSNSLSSWQTNFTFAPTLFEPENSFTQNADVSVHSGTYEVARRLYARLLPLIDDHIRSDPQARVCFTGHSLGGSLALLVALMVMVRRREIRNRLLPVYTFGAPYVMCGGDRLLKRLGQTRGFVQSVVMGKDIVPRAFSCYFPAWAGSLLGAPRAEIGEMYYNPMGTMLVLQPGHGSAHPALPQGPGLYAVCQPRGDGGSARGEPSGERRQGHRQGAVQGPPAAAAASSAVAGLAGSASSAVAGIAAAARGGDKPRLWEEGESWDKLPPRDDTLWRRLRKILYSRLEADTRDSEALQFEAAEILESEAAEDDPANSLARLSTIVQQDALLVKNLILPSLPLDELGADPSTAARDAGSRASKSGRARKQAFSKRGSDDDNVGWGGLPAERIILNWPHPLTVLSDSRAYGPGGSISRHHNPHNYTKAIGYARRMDPAAISKNSGHHRPTPSSSPDNK